MPADPVDVALIRAALKRAAGRGKLFAALLFGLALLPLARFIPEGKYDLAVVLFAMLAAVAALIWWIATRADPSHNPLARTLVEDPERIERIEHTTSTSSSGAMKMNWLRVTTAGKSFVFRADLDEIAALAPVLARHCPRAHVTAPGFERPAP